MKEYSQLNDEDRIEEQAGKKQNIIAVVLGVAPSTISRELSRNAGLRGYCPKQGQQKALQRRLNARYPRKAVKMVLPVNEAVTQLEKSRKTINFTT